MNENIEKQMLSKLKKQTCEQQDCLSSNQDNVQLVIFGNPQAKKNGLMCSECFIDSSLLKQLSPVQKYVLPIKKYLNIIINYHKEYVQLKQSLSWGPNIINKQAEGIKRKVEAFYNDEWKFILEVTQYVDSLTKKAIDDLKKIYQDVDFDKIVEFLNEENEVQQQRINLTNQLSRICKNIKLIEGKHCYATQNKIRKQADEVVQNYHHNLERVIFTLKDLNEVQKDCMGDISG